MQYFMHMIDNAFLYATQTPHLETCLLVTSTKLKSHTCCANREVIAILLKLKPSETRALNEPVPY